MSKRKLLPPAISNVIERFLPAEQNAMAPREPSLLDKPREMKRKMVLIVDDDTTLAEELKHLLTQKNLVVETLSEAAYVVKIAEEKQPDIILLDMKMPGKSGFQVADDLKQFSATAAIPIIAMTGHYTQSQHRNFMMSLGISDCIIKPFDPRDVISKVEQFMCGSKDEVENANEGTASPHINKQ